jgi:hypothetical protein
LIDFCLKSFFNGVSNERGLPVGLGGNKNKQWHLELVAEFHLEHFFHLRKRQSEIRERNRMIRETKTLVQTGRQRKKEPKSSPYLKDENTETNKEKDRK